MGNFVVIVLKDMNVKIRQQKFFQLVKTHCHHWMFVLPRLGNTVCGFADAQFKRLPVACAPIMPGRVEGEVAALMAGAMANAQVVVDFVFVDCVKAEHAAWL